MSSTDIEWTWGPHNEPGESWNNVRGCFPEDLGCKHCYAMGQAHRSSGPGGAYEGLTEARAEGKGPVWTGSVRVVHDLFGEPFSWKRPRWVFVNSMSDLFYEEVPLEATLATLGVIAIAHRHIFIVLTKRTHRAREILSMFTHGDFRRALEEHVQRYPDPRISKALEKAKRSTAEPLRNLWLGASVCGALDRATSQKEAARIHNLMKTPVEVRIVSAEPTIGPGTLELLRPWLFDRDAAIHEAKFGPRNLTEEEADATIGFPIDWVIIGGESGGKARPMQLSWAEELIAACQATEVPVFMKQAGRRPMGEIDVPASRLVLKNRKGGDLSELPEALRVREWPSAGQYWARWALDGRSA